MKLEDIFVKKNYCAKKIDGLIVANPARGGNYRATSAKDVELALTDGTQAYTVLVRPTKNSNGHCCLVRERPKIRGGRSNGFADIFNHGFADIFNQCCSGEKSRRHEGFSAINFRRTHTET